MLAKGKYRHYKGPEYEVFRVVLHTETNEKMVYYRACSPCDIPDSEFGEELHFVRPYDMFVGEVELEGVWVPRFKYIGS